ncbi:hypothetical protein LINGRAHAP2_LOCUS8150, partial [Linum grandiflorum]
KFQFLLSLPATLNGKIIQIHNIFYYLSSLLFLLPLLFSLQILTKSRSKIIVVVSKSSADHYCCLPVQPRPPQCFRVTLRLSRLSMIPDPTTSSHGAWCFLFRTSVSSLPQPLDLDLPALSTRLDKLDEE